MLLKLTMKCIDGIVRRHSFKILLTVIVILIIILGRVLYIKNNQVIIEVNNNYIESWLEIKQLCTNQYPNIIIFKMDKTDTLWVIRPKFTSIFNGHNSVSNCVVIIKNWSKHTWGKDAFGPVIFHQGSSNGTIRFTDSWGKH